MRKLGSRGFTIIELMIATAVLSTIILMVTVLMMNISNLYYKGINQSRVQDNTRGIVDDVASHLQLSDHSPSYGTAVYPTPPTSGDLVSAVCIDNIRYSYAIGTQIGNTPAPSGLSNSVPLQHVLWRDTISSGANCIPADLTQTNPSTATGGTGGVELISPKSRLPFFQIVPSGSIYTLAVEVAYGDDDLLCSPSVANSCNSNNKMSHLSDYSQGDLQCKGHTGDQFCATSKLQVTVAKRLTDNSL